MDKAAAPISIWETRGPDEGQVYDANYFQHIGKYQPVKTDSSYAYSVEVKPYSIVTITTLDKTADTSVYKCSYENTPLDVNYSDDFEYEDDFLSARGNAPLYTTDYGGAFEVAVADGNKVLMQMINADNKPTDWRLRGTPNPITSLGDDRWSNYSAEIDFQLADTAQENYISFGVRYLTAELDAGTAQNGYSVQIRPDGTWELYKNAQAAANGTISDFDSSKWHTVQVTAAGQTISVSVDKKKLTVYEDEMGYANSGRISIGSGLYNNLFDNLKVTPMDDMPSAVTRLDDHDAAVTYTGDWYRTVPEGYIQFNRTISRTESSEDNTEEKSFMFQFTGTHFALIGETAPASLEVYVDGELLETAEITQSTRPRQCSYAGELPDGVHSVVIKVLDGTFTLDAIEYS